MASSTTPDAAETRAAPSAAPRPSWHEGAIWMGASLPALASIVWQGGARVWPAYWLDLAIDSVFAAGNSVLGAVEAAAYARRVSRIPVPEDPIIVLGHWRTGTTLLHELLALDPRHRAPTTFECFLPNHFLLTQRWLKPWTGFVLPKTRWFDNVSVGWDLPQEDEFAILNTGLGSPYATVAFPNQPAAHWRYLDLDDLSPHEQRRWERGFTRFLRRLIAAQPGRLVLKSPPHTCRVPTLTRLFRRAKFVYVVREPYAVFPSTVGLWKSLYSAHGYQSPRLAGLEEFVLETFNHFHQRFEATKPLIPGGNLAIVRYEDLVGNPLAALRRLYDDLELGDFSGAQPLVEDYLARKSDYRPNRHPRDATTCAMLRERWKDYFAAHGYD